MFPRLSLALAAVLLLPGCCLDLPCVGFDGGAPTTRAAPADDPPPALEEAAPGG